MKKKEIRIAIAMLVIVFSVIGSTNAHEVSLEADVHKQHTNTSLESSIERDLNCTENSETHLKSRRKRYVAFPEGSSFSVMSNETNPKN